MTTTNQYLACKENELFCKPHFSLNSTFIIISLTKISKFQWKKKLHEILNEKEHDDIYDSTAINKDITLEETQATSQYLKPGKAAGPDKVFTDLLLKANEELVKAIHNLLLFSFKTGTLPSDWKSADVKFLRKSGKKNYNSASAYRPISLTSCLGKCLERIITVRLNGFLIARR